MEEDSRRVHTRSRADRAISLIGRERRDGVGERLPLDGSSASTTSALAFDLRSEVSSAREARRKEDRRSGRRFRALIENASDLVAILGPEGTVRYASPSHRRVLGYEPEELIGRSAFDFVHPDDCARMLDLFAAGMQSEGTSATAEFRFLHKVGSWRVLEGAATNRLDDPLIAGAVVNSRDVTERKRAEERLAAQAAELERNQDEVEAFTRAVTHDLKNPVSAIVLLADRMLRSRSSSNGEDLERIRGLARRIEDMLRDLLHLSRITSPLEKPEWVDLQTLAERIVEDLEPQIVAKRVRVIVGELPRVWGQPGKLFHLLINLVANAVKYVPAERGKVTIRGGVEGETTILSVEDNGIGIPAGQRDRIFELFGRVRSHVDGRPVEGTGVGLAIVKRVAEAHGGGVEVDRRAGGGSRFIVRLPHYL